MEQRRTRCAANLAAYSSTCNSGCICVFIGSVAHDGHYCGTR